MPVYERTRRVSLAQSDFEWAFASARMSKKVFSSKAFNCVPPSIVQLPRDIRPVPIVILLYYQCGLEFKCHING